MREDERVLKRFMYANLYHHPRQLAAADAAHGVVAGLFAAYHADPALMPEDWSRAAARRRAGAQPAYRRFHRRDDRSLCR